jgi:hypothetical protein
VYVLCVCVYVVFVSSVCMCVYSVCMCVWSVCMFCEVKVAVCMFSCGRWAGRHWVVVHVGLVSLGWLYTLEW